MYEKLGSIPFSNEYLAEETVGHWVIEKDPGKEPRMYVDDVMLGLIGLEKPLSPEENFKVWLAGIDEKYLDSVLETERMNVDGIHAEVQYPWHYPDGHTILIRCEGMRNYSYTAGIRTEGRHRDISALIHLQKESAVIGALSADFECVNYIILHENKEDDIAIPFRTSERIKKLIPGWEQEKSFHNRLEMLIQYCGIEEEISSFRAQTRREVILEHLDTEPAYYVNTRAKVSGGTEYFQMKFMADRDADGHLAGIVAGLHSIDDEMKAELDMRERSERLVSDRTRELRSKNEALSRVHNRMIELVGNIVESRDEDSGEHINRVKYLSRTLAYQVMKDLPEYGLAVKDVSLIADLSPLHDVGKIKIPDSILLKPGKLTEAEFGIMKTHCEKGREILDSMAGDWTDEIYRLSLDICMCHHEKWDGKGYPQGLKGDEIPIAAQIVSIADIYDALVSKRVYKSAYSHDEAYRMITEGECGAFSKKLLGCFERCRDAFASSSAYIKKSLSDTDEGLLFSAGGEYISGSVPLLEQLSESMPGGFFIYQADGDEKFIYFNEMMVDYLGCESRTEFAEHTRNSFKGLVHPEDYDAVTGEIYSQISQNRLNLDHIVYRVIRKDGKIRWFDDYGRFIHSEDMGDIFVVFINDITDAYIRRDTERTAGKKKVALKVSGSVPDILKGRRILVTDDSKLARDSLRDVLEDAGAVVSEAVNGLEAVNLVKGGAEFDLILMDLVMPVMSGVSAVSEIIKIQENSDRKTPIFCLTAEGTDMQVKQALDAGAFEVLYKPFNIDELCRHIESAETF